MTIDSAPITTAATAPSPSLAPAAPLKAPQVDVRGPRFNAWITSFVLAAGLLLSSGWILLFQTAVFAVGAFVGLRHSPYSNRAQPDRKSVV